MTKIFCPEEDCKHNDKGICTREQIDLSKSEVSVKGSYYEFLECDRWELNKPPFTEEETKAIDKVLT